MSYIIYCDGSAKGNGQVNSYGGWGFVILRESQKIIEGAQAENHTTNNRMELLACINALTSLKNQNKLEEPIEVFTDSAYLHNCWKNKWYVNWKKNGWVNAKKQPVANKDLWERLLEFFDKPNITFSKVAGHAGVEWNEYVDSLAQSAAESLKQGVI